LFYRHFQTTSDGFHQLIFDDFEGVFAILMGGCAFNLVFFIAELVIKKRFYEKKSFELINNN